MFKKPWANLKSFSPLRSSDRRRFQNEAYEAYPLIKEQCTAEGASHLMPDDLRSAKFIAHAGHSGLVYMSEKQVLWIAMESLPPVPTVYTLWQYPDMLPKLYTWGPVVHKLMEGADLMIPGLVLGPEGVLPTLDTGALVAITMKGYTYPLAIGTMAVPTSTIKPRSGQKGKAVHVIHVYHDYLWSMGDKSDPPQLQVDSNDDEYEEEVQEEEERKAPESKQTVQLTTAEVDDWLKKSLYQALVYRIKKDQTSLFPLSASSFYSAYIMPSRPLEIGSEIDIKKSSWKKLQKFLKAMEKTGLLKTKEQRGETMIMSVNYSHPELQSISRYKTIAQDPQPKKEQEKPVETKTTPTHQAEVQELFKPLGPHLIKLFEDTDHDKNKMYTIPEIRQVMTDYIKLNHLVDLKNQKMIQIDVTLCDALLSKQEYNAVHQLPRDQLLHRICQKMQPFHMIKLPGKEPVVQKGSPKPVEITQEIRQGRKTVTKITGVEGFGLDVDDLAKELTRLCASSATCKYFILYKHSLT
ncbi:hypothetical protein EDC96DRAFT_521710 [Choanephora cucurbitarum]|nr:hypothetical protein EDC96DRAFT_521710 [Choanephora cucurbitarum]